MVRPSQQEPPAVVVGRAPAARKLGTYEERLANDLTWALSEGSRHFEGESTVQEALRKTARRVSELGVAYAVAGGLALFAHGYRRFTEDVNVLISARDLTRIHEELGGYVPAFEGSKGLRDAQLGVRIEFLVTGQYPGDGKPKPVAFPQPEGITIERDGIRYLNLTTLVELKLASGMTSPGRMKDLADVQELIKLLSLPASFAEQLNPYVREKFAELWTGVRSMKRYIKLWHGQLFAAGAKSIDEFIDSLEKAASILKSMRAHGVVLEPAAASGGVDFYLVTTDPDVARKYDMHDEDEFLKAVQHS